jgi:NADP-dependent 3-hydroxy acid dehydrogenase YdfG
MSTPCRAVGSATRRRTTLGDRLGGKVTIVTGAGSRIGRASAIRFAEEGARVTCIDVNRRAPTAP